MNCKNVEELMPLYVGRDLEESRARLVTAHVQACTECARSAQEYGEANQLLQLFEPPQFNEATYAAIRSGVLREIKQESSAPTLLQFFARPFRPQLRWAVSTAVLLAACVFAYYFIAGRTNGRQIAGNLGGGEQKPRDKQATDGPQPDPLKPSPLPSRRDPKPESDTQRRTAATLPKHSIKSRLSLTAPWHPRRKESLTAAPVASAQYSPVEPKVTSPNTSATTEKALRLEIQTSDRNIRIIWFSHPSNNEGSPNESSKGT